MASKIIFSNLSRNDDYTILLNGQDMGTILPLKTNTIDVDPGKYELDVKGSNEEGLGRRNAQELQGNGPHLLHFGPFEAGWPVQGALEGVGPSREMERGSAQDWSPVCGRLRGADQGGVLRRPWGIQQEIRDELPKGRSEEEKMALAAERVRVP